MQEGAAETWDRHAAYLELLKGGAAG
jgi:hypothetical protein